MHIHKTWSAALCAVSVFAANANPAGTAADYARAEQFLPWNVTKLAFSLNVEPHWLDGTDRFWYRIEKRAGKQFMLVDPYRNTHAPAFDHARLAAALSRAKATSYTATALPFDVIELLNGDEALRFDFDGESWTCDLISYRCAVTAPHHVPGDLVSPDGRWAAFLKDHNLWLRSTVTGEVIQLTSDGAPNFDYGSTSGSGLSFVTDQLSPTKFPPIAVWSPDSQRLLTHRLDQRAVGEMALLQSVPPAGLHRPVLWTYPYPLPGDENLPTAQYFVFDIGTGSKVAIEGGPLLVLYTTPIERQEIRWSGDGAKVYFMRVERGMKAWKFCVAEPSTGTERVMVEERSATFLDPNFARPPLLRVIEEGAGLIAYSERDGWGHLYLHDTKTGAIRNRITKGAWQVRDIVFVDERTRTVYFTAGGREPGRDPYFRHLYRSSLDNLTIELLTHEDADHQVSASPSGRYFVDTYSRVDLPPTTGLRAADGRVIRVLEEADIEPLRANGWRAPERFSAKAADGVTDLYGVIYRPSRFDRTQKYPVIDSIYPGPQTIRSSKSFLLPGRGEAESLAELGFIVVTVDGRGTAFRSKAFQDISYGDIGQAGNLADHIAVFRQLAERYTEFDLDRVGIIGHSAGGYAAARALLAYPDFYHVGVSSAGLHDLRGYNADWGEIYQGLPNGENYENQANTDLAAALTGKLLLIYGDLDDNVPPALTLQLINSLIEANRDFDVLVLPNRNHSTSYTDPYATRRRWDYFVEHLLGIEPPREYLIKSPGEEGAVGL